MSSSSSIRNSGLHTENRVACQGLRERFGYGDEYDMFTS